MENNEKKTAQLIIESLKLKDKELSRNGYDLQSPFRQGFMLAETIVKKTVNKNKADEDLSDNEKKLFSLLGLNEPSPNKGETATGEGANFHQVVEGSHHFTEIEQIIEYVKAPYFERGLSEALQETINRGYQINTTPPKGIEAGKSLEEWKDKVDFYDLNAHERYKALEGLCMELYASQRQGCETSNIISFGNHLRCEIKANANKIEVINAVNGWGDNIPLSEIDILSKELPQPPSNKL